MTLAQHSCWPKAAKQRALGRCWLGSVRALPVAAWEHHERGPACQPVRALAAWQNARPCSARCLPGAARARPTVDLHSVHT
ncbi:hypothetical protein Q8G81_33150, partial [Klebsiella pneumoniae]